MLFFVSPKFPLRNKHCFQFLLGLTITPRETENHADAKFWTDNKECFKVFLKKAYVTLFSLR